MRFSGSSRLPAPAAAVWAAILIAVMCLPAGPLRAQEEEDLTAGLAELRLHFDRGKAHFQELNFPAAIEELGKVVEIYEGGRLSTDLGDRQIALVAEALDLRARAYFNLGDQPRAREDFAKLLHVKIDYKIDARLVSPKVVALFEDVAKQLVGTLSVTTDPPGAEAWLNDEPLPRTPILGRPVIAASYRLKLRSKGFQDHAEEITVSPRTELKREIRLVPNRRDLQFVTQPTGVNVMLDGVQVGTTFGTLPAHQYSLAKDAGLEPSRTSSPLIVKAVAPGTHEVRFEKECYDPALRSIMVSLDTERNSVQAFQPVALKENLGQLKITSSPSGAEVFVDEVSQGTTPIQLSAVCAGERELRLRREEGGTWFERVRIQPGVVNTLAVRLRPTLLYLGTFRVDDFKRLTWSDEDKVLLEALQGIRSVNQVRPSEALRDFRSALVTEMMRKEYVDELTRGAGLPPQRVSEAAAKFEADLVMAVISLQDEPGRGAPRLFLYSSEQPDPDVVRLNLASSEDVKTFLTRLDRVPDLTRPWIGAVVTDTLLGEGPVVARVVKGSPAASAGILPGDQVVAVNGRQAKDARSVSAVTSTAVEKDRMAWIVRRREKPMTLNLTVGRTPVLIPLNAPDRLYNKALADFRQLSRGADDPLDRALALLNLGVAFLHFRSYDRALAESFNVVNLPAGGGISRGTVRYYQGVCYLRKEMVPEARAALQDAAAAGDATLESNDGAPVAARARKLLQ